MVHLRPTRYAATVQSVVLILVYSGLSPTLGANEATAEPPPHVGVLIIGQSAAPDEDLRKAVHFCLDIFRAAKIRVTWMNALEDLSWEGPDIVIRGAILPRAPVPKPADVFGTALPEKRHGLQFFIFYDRVLRLSKLADLPVHVVLCGALAHEAGHVLLGSAEHAVAGIMRGEWGGQQLSELSQGLLRFTPQQRRQITSRVLSSASARR